MNTNISNRRIKIIAALTLAVSTLIYAVATFIPETQPTVRLGKYALKNNDLLQGDTKAYRPWFENGAWQGDLIEYDITGYCTSCGPDDPQPGSRNTTAPVGETDNAALLTYANLVDSNPTNYNWMARATFLLKEDRDALYWEKRKIITNNAGQVDFLWNNLNAAQKYDLDPITIADPDGDGDPSDAILDLTVDQTPDDFSPILNFIRGDRSLERDKPGGFLRRRYNLLGDVTNTPVYITPPRELFVNLDGFSNFSSKMSPFSASPCTGYDTGGMKQGCRPGRIATPANDGMLHIFDEDDGSEVYAYIPSMVIDKLGKLAARDETYKHTYYLDGELISGSAQVGPSYSTCSNADSVYDGCNWSTILTGGGGPGFAGLFALDVTDPTSSGNKVLFEKTIDDDNDNIGHIYGQPRIAPLRTAEETFQPKWFVFTGNGYSTDPAHPTKLLMVSLDGSNNDVVSIATSGNSTGGLSSPALLSTDGDVIVDVAFAGDMNGDIWMFRINNTSPELTAPGVKVFEGSTERPITNTPTLAEYPPLSGNYFLYFGTGSIFSEIDALDDISQQAVYGIWIKKEWIDGTDTSEMPITDHPDSITLVKQELGSSVGDASTAARVMANENTVDLLKASIPDKGWRVDLPNCGERLVGAPFLRSERLQFITSNPTGTLDCSGTDKKLVGDSWMMSLDYITGGDADTVVYNLNGDGALDDADMADYDIKDSNGDPTGTIEKRPPVGLNLGKGNISQPALARLRSAVDKMYINGLILQFDILPKSGPLLSGHIDVQTDSPFSGVEATNTHSLLSEGYQTPLVGDGLGKGIDGHVHDYDSIHLVDNVDLFELEPRRRLPNPTPLDPSAMIEAELNRAYDVITQVPPSNTEPWCPVGYTGILDDNGAVIVCQKPGIESEVYTSIADNPDLLNPNQKFIVVVANADISFSGTLQIGCRTWPVLEYQDAITKELEAALLAGDLDPGDPIPSYFNTNDLVFTLSDIYTDTTYECPEANTSDTVSKGLSPNPTLRVGFGQRAILDEGLHGTRAQCVLGLHDYRDKACYTDEEVLSGAHDALTNSILRTDNPLQFGSTTRGGTGDACEQFKDVDISLSPDYIRDPAWNMHITEVPTEEGTGYRWRNGALTLQLLAVKTDATTGADLVGFSLQQPTQDIPALVGNKTTTIQSLPFKKTRFGGTHAKAYDWGYNDAGDIVMITSQYRDTNGMLYEASMFWHYSDLNDGLRNLDPDSSSAPQDTPCYGGDNYKSALTKERGGLTLGEYQFLTSPLLEECAELKAIDPDATCDLARFGELVGQIDSLEGEALEAALLEMAALLQGNELLRKYANYRDYAPGHVPEQHLLPWDVNQDDPDGEQSSLDAVPAKVISIETIDLETKGLPIFGSSIIWTDITQ